MQRFRSVLCSPLAIALCLLAVGSPALVSATGPAGAPDRPRDEAEVRSRIRAWRSGSAEGRSVRILDDLLAERIEVLNRLSPTFGTSWRDLELSGTPVLIGTESQLGSQLPGALRGSNGWAGATVTWAGTGGVPKRTAVVIRVDWLQELHESFGNPRGDFLRALDDLIIHEVYGHLVPVVEARNVAASCADARRGERHRDSCVGRRELAIHAEVESSIRLGLAP
jgi:hypothetical protein